MVAYMGGHYSSVSQLFGDGNVECRDYRDLHLNSTCEFMKTTDDCQIDDGFVNYLVFVFCNFSDSSVGGALFLLFLWLFVLFVGLGVTADAFFCPSLRVIADSLKLSQNIAAFFYGVTFLAFGNGAPDVFSAIAAITNAKDGDAGLAFGALFGAGIFVSTVIVGTICFIKPFTSMQRPLLRDIIFFMIAGFWTFVIVWDGYINIGETLGFLFMYVVYILVVVVGRYVNQKRKRRLGISSKNDFSSASAPTTPRASINIGKSEDEDDALDEETEAFQREHSPLLHEHAHLVTAYSKKTDIIKGLRPFQKEEWMESNLFFKAVLLVKAPVMMVLKITIPLVDYEIDEHNWNKFVMMANCVTAPTFMVFATKLAFKQVFTGFPFWALAIIISVILLGLVAYFTEWQEKPKYHWLFSYAGFLVSVVWIYIIANEIVNLLTAFGVIMDISNTILGLTFLAWGNSLADFVADVMSARQGYPNMGISACYGGPLFNLLLGIGIPFTFRCIQQGGGFTVKTSLLQDILALFMGISLVTTIIYIPCNKFRFDKRFGIWLLILYVVALTVCILVEAGVIA